MEELIKDINSLVGNSIDFETWYKIFENFCINYVDIWVSKEGGLEKTKEYFEILLNSNVLCKSCSEEILLKSAKNKLKLLLGFLNENIGKDSSNGKIKK